MRKRYPSSIARSAPVRRRALGHDVRSFTDLQALAWRPFSMEQSMNRLFIHPKTRSLIRVPLRDAMAPEDVLTGVLKNALEHVSRSDQMPCIHAR